MSIERDTDEDWVSIAESEPYFGVMSDPRFLSAQMDDAAKHAFFAAGRDYVDDILGRLLPMLDGKQIRSALDFGCGVGRLLLPMSSVCASVAGVDVAPRMRDLAMENAKAAGVTNVTVHENIDALPAAVQFDWVNSYIVFQHIPPARGYALLEALLTRLRSGGVFSLHFTVARDRSLLRANTNPIDLYRLEERTIRPLAVYADSGETRMSMFDYDLNVLMPILYRHGADEIRVRHSIHGGHYSTILFGRRVHSLLTHFLRVGETLRFDANGATRLLVRGFGVPEEWGVWTTGDVAELDLPISVAGPLVLVFEGAGFTPSGAAPQKVTVAVNGRNAAVWYAARGDPQEFRLPLDIAPGSAPLRISLAIANPCAPIDCGEGNDFRRIGLGLRSVRIEAR